MLQMQDMRPQHPRPLRPRDRGPASPATPARLPGWTRSPPRSTPAARSDERLLTPLEALHIFRAQETTPTAPLREDHFDREAAGPEKVDHRDGRGRQPQGRPQVGRRAARRNDLRRDASEALAAMNDRPLTEHANIRLRQARRSQVHRPGPRRPGQAASRRGAPRHRIHRERRDQDRVLDRGDSAMTDLVAQSEDRASTAICSDSISTGGPGPRAHRAGARGRVEADRHQRLLL